MIQAPIIMTAYLNFATAASANGLMIPEHPGRSPGTYGGITYEGNSEWSNYKSLYDEFRVMSIITEFQPGLNSGYSGTIQMVGLCDYDSEIAAGTVTTCNLAMKYSTARLLSPSTEHALIFKPTTQRSFPLWQSTENSTARGSVYYFLQSTTGGALSSASVGTLVVKWIVAFRNTNG